MEQEQTTRTVSLASSNYTWDDIDKRAKKLGFDRSKYIQRLIDKDIKNDKNIKLLDIIIVFFLVAIFILLLAVFILGW